MRRTLFAALLLTLHGASACAPVQASRLYVRGTEALDRGDVTRAVDDLEQAAALVPEASEVQNHLGLAYGAAGRDQDALAAFERAVALDCDNHAAQQNLRAAESRASGASSP
jgi:Flp pilus assembly protein TadD